MNFLTAMDISASGLTAQRGRMNLIAMNLSHMNTTHTPEGGPYRAKLPVFSAMPVYKGMRGRFKDSLDRELDDVKITEIVEDQRDFKMIFDPSHPDADQFGYVLMPNINVIEEMVDMVSAKRSYEAGVTAIGASHNMALKALEILR
ncbi:MAG: flagellar basal body rod protein FlgC [Proteobacteria bacterium]|nr:flagellar basal body rod protein FlgC [Pseudomonadota bacterium]